MNVGRPPTIVVLGMMSKMPVPGNIWLVAQYLEGFRRLGCEVYYVEAHGITPTKLMDGAEDDGALKAAAFIAGVMRRFDLSDHWAFHSRYEDRYFGMSRTALHALYASADLIINLHGGTVPLPEHAATGRLVYLETDPVALQIELHDRDAAAVAFLEPHVALFTWGLNYGAPDCRVPQDPRFEFHPSCPPVIADFWPSGPVNPEARFTTVGNWRQPGIVVYEGDEYHWSKDREFLKVLDLPSLAGRRFELALSRSSYDASDLALLTAHGWQVRDAFVDASDLEAYRTYICASLGEFTVAKDQNVRLRSGWFSERSAQYLASGRPVIMQDTGFGRVLPTGAGLFSFTSLDDAASAVESVVADYSRHAAAAAAIARTYCDYTVVLGDILSRMGMMSARPARRP